MWSKVPLGEIANLQAGAGFPPALQGRKSGELPLAKVGDISRAVRSGGQGLVAPLNYITRAEAKDLRAFVFPAESTVFAKIGEAISQNFRLFTDRDAAFDNNVMGAVPKRDKVLPQYLFRFLQTVDLYSYASKTTVPALRKSELELIPVPLPPLPEQHRIADVLDKADAVRRKRKEAIALTEELLRSTFMEMFGDPVTNPKGWARKPLTALGAVTTGNTPSRNIPEYFGEAIEWIKSDNINTPSHYLTRAVEGLSEKGKAVGRVAPAGSTLMTCIAGSADCIGNVGLTDRDVAFNQQINSVTPTAGVDHRWLYVLLLLGKRLVQGASTNSMKGMVSKGKLEQVLWPLPPREQQATFGARFESVLKLSKRQVAAAGESDALFGSLAQRAFRGELTGGGSRHRLGVRREEPDDVQP